MVYDDDNRTRRVSELLTSEDRRLVRLQILADETATNEEGSLTCFQDCMEMMRVGVYSSEADEAIPILTDAPFIVHESCSKPSEQ